MVNDCTTCRIKKCGFGLRLFLEWLLEDTPLWSSVAEEQPQDPSITERSREAVRARGPGKNLVSEATPNRSKQKLRFTSGS